ncbi:hypothetical protein BsWGS_16109 [Bradybaena similaris]
MRVLISNATGDDVDDFVRPIMTCSNINALSLALVDIGKNNPYVREYGIDTKRTSTSATGSKIFCIGGATRAFTAVLLAKLLTNHPNITWDTPIQDIVKDRIDLPYQYLANNLNLKDIFAMRSGLAGLDIVTVAKPYSVDELIQNLRYAPPVAGFREKFIYNEVLFSLVEKVLHVLGNDTWQNLITDHIFKPLNMMSTTFLGPDVYRNPDFVKGVVQHNNKPNDMDADSYSGLELVAPAASVCTSAADMVKWLTFLLKGGKTEHNQVIVEKAALEATYTAIQSRGTDADPAVPSYNMSILLHYSRDSNAIGWINGFYTDLPFVSQDGSIPGYQSLATIVPSKNLAVYVAFSGDHDVTRYAAKVLLNQMGIDFLTNRSRNTTEICNIIRSVTEINKKHEKRKSIYRTSAPIPRPLEDYVGKYRHYAYGDIHVKRGVDDNDARDGLILQYGLAEYTLHTTTNNNTFQLFVRKGGLWYSTSADWYRDNQQIFAEFISDSEEQDQKFTCVRIDGFDRHYIPEFSRNARKPQYEKYTEDYRCSAPVLRAWQWAIILVITAMSFS